MESDSETGSRLDAAGAATRIYPYWDHAANFSDRNPPPTS